MNWIQRHILVQLTLHPSRRYSDMRPDGVEGNLFLYHLDQLVRDGYVEKAHKAYQLSLKGRQLAGVISVDSGKLRQQPKIVVMLVIQNAAGEYLLFRWRRQPYVNLISLPYGKTHFGASIFAMAERELAMKCSLTGTLTRLGDAYINTTASGKPFSHMLAHIFRVTGWTGDPISTVQLGTVFWGKPTNLNPMELTPGFVELLSQIESAPSRPFFTEITAELAH